MQLNSKYTVTNVWQKQIKFCKAIILQLKNKTKQDGFDHLRMLLIQHVFIIKSLIWYSNFKKWAEYLNRYVSRMAYMMAKIHMKKSSTSQIRDMQIKTTMEYHITPVRMTYQKDSNKQMLERIWRKGNPNTLLMEL